MDTLAMHRTLTESGMPAGQADAIIRVVQGGVATKHDLDAGLNGLRHDLNLAVTKLEGRIERLDTKMNLLFGVGLLAVLAPTITRLIVGP